MDFVGLCYLCASAGLIMIVGSLILISKRIIFIDVATQKVTEIELPLGFKVKTQTPVILLFVLGGFLLVFPIWQLKDRLKGGNLELTTMTGKIKAPGTDKLKVYAVVGVDETNNGEVRLKVPLVDYEYQFYYWTGSTYLGREFKNPLKATNGQQTELHGYQETELVNQQQTVVADLSKGQNPPDLPTDVLQKYKDHPGETQ